MKAGWGYDTRITVPAFGYVSLLSGAGDSREAQSRGARNSQ